VLSFTAAEAERFVAALVLPFLRILALYSSAPLFSHATVPRPARIGLAALTAALLVPTLPPPPDVPLVSAAGLMLVAVEIAIGLAIGFFLQLVFAAVELAGDAIGLQMGLSFAAFIDPQNQTPTPIVGSLLSIVLILVFLATNAHLMLLAALGDSFVRWPVGTTPGWPEVSTIVAQGAFMFDLGLRIALPVIGVLLLVNLALGVLARTAPQLNLFAVGFPLTLIGGIAAMVLAMPAMVATMERALGAALARLGG
jgi:flagellar biosynthetic protein FliR